MPIGTFKQQSPQMLVQPSFADANRYRLAQMMSEQGSDTSPVQSPWQGVARLAQALVGGLQSNKIEKEYESREKAAQEKMKQFANIAGGLEAFQGREVWTDPAGFGLAIAAMAENEDLAPLAAELTANRAIATEEAKVASEAKLAEMMLGHERKKEELQLGDQYKRGQIELKAKVDPSSGSSGNTERLKPISRIDAMAIEKAQAAATNGSQLRGLLENFKSVLGNTSTSATEPVIGQIGRGAAAIGIATNDMKSRAAAFEDMTAMAKDMGIIKLSLIGGSDTERELAVAIQTSPSAEKTKDANNKIIERQLKAAEILEQYPDFQSAWVEKNGSLSSSDRDTGEHFRSAWRKYQRETFSNAVVRGEKTDVAIPALPDGFEMEP